MGIFGKIHGKMVRLDTNRRKYNKQLKEGNTNMGYEQWQLHKKIMKGLYNASREKVGMTLEILPYSCDLLDLKLLAKKEENKNVKRRISK